MEDDESVENHEKWRSLKRLVLQHDSVSDGKLLGPSILASAEQCWLARVAIIGADCGHLLWSSERKEKGKEKKEKEKRGDMGKERDAGGEKERNWAWSVSIFYF